MVADAGSVGWQELLQQTVLSTQSNMSDEDDSFGPPTGKEAQPHPPSTLHPALDSSQKKTQRGQLQPGSASGPFITYPAL